MAEPVAPQPDPTAGTFSLPFSSIPYTNGTDSTNIGDPAGALPEHDPPPQTGRYRALHLHARGGLGEVFVAQDLEIDRTVALKRMQPRFQQHEVPRLRFLREVEVTGQLEHPGIVPVYGLVSDADGMPYYAMRFIDGESLQAALERYHADEAVQRDPVARRMGLRQLVSRVVAACNAIAFAHSRGVIHRDIKPANIMLGRFGETLVVDWGLAKRVGEPQPRSGADTDPDFATDDAPATADDSLTRPGTYAGTAAFMSPEQAAGDWDNVGPASDQFSLGATLYNVLTGRAPIEGSNLSKIERAREARFVPPRQLRPTVPRALDAVCARAMAKSTGNRYATVAAFADDLERFLAGEPVAAMPESWPERGRRWARAHPRAVTAAGLLSVSLLALLSLWFHLVSKTNREISVKNQQVEVSERQAMKLNRLLQSVIEPADPLGLNTLTRDMALPPAAEAAASRFLIARLSEFVNEAELEQAPRVRASLLRTLGNAHRSISEFTKAEPYLREVVALSEQYLPENDTDRAAAYLQYGWLLQDQADLSGAMVQYRKALDIQRNRMPPDPLAIAAVEFNMAYLNMFTGEGVESERLFRHVIETREQHLGRDHRLIAVSKLALSMLYLDRDRVTDAQTLIHEAAAILARQPSAETLHRAVVEFEGAVINARLGREESAIATLRKIIELVTNSNLGEGHWVMGFLRFELGSIYRSLGRYDESIAEFQRTRDIAVALVGWKHPKLTEVIDGLAETYAAKKDLPAARREFDELIRQLKLLFPEGHVFLADALMVYASFLKSEGQRSDAERLLDEALAIYGRPADLTGRRHGPALRLRARLRADRGDHAGAMADLEAAVPLFDRLAGPDHPNTLLVRTERAIALAHLSRHAEAAIELDAILAGREARDDDEADVIYDAGLARARLYHFVGQPTAGEPLVIAATNAARKHFVKNPGAAARAELLSADLAVAAGQPGSAAKHLIRAQLRFAENTERNRTDVADAMHRRAILELKRKDTEAAVIIHGELLDFAAAQNKPAVWRKAARSLVVAPYGDLTAVVPHIGLPGDRKPARVDAQTVGAALVLTGAIEQGVALLQSARQSAAGRPTPWEDLFLALADWNSGKRMAARPQLDAVSQLLERPAPKPAWNDTSGWVTAAELRLARDRVAALMKE